MAVEGSFQSLGLSIVVNDPLAWTDRVLADTLTEQVASYSHEVAALGGYQSAAFSIRDRQEKLEDWFDRGLGRHIKVYDESLTQVWEGFANKVSLAVGPLSVTRGPLLDIGNRVSLTYSTVDTLTTPPTVGVRATTAVANDTDSQDRYGIVQKVLSAGGVAAAEATQIRDTYLEEHKDPETSKQLSLGSGGKPTVSVDCLGYVHWLVAYVYNQTTTTGSYNLSLKIADILDADPNSFFASTNANITANTLQVADWENDDRIAWDLIKGLVAHGDVNENRYLFSVFNDRYVIYEAAPTAVGYYQRLRDPEQRIETAEGQKVRPWSVRAGRWLLFPDFLVGRTVPAALRDDARAMFIENVQFSAPFGLQLSGGKTDTLRQKLAQLGLGGVGA